MVMLKSQTGKHCVICLFSLSNFNSFRICFSPERGLEKIVRNLVTNKTIMTVDCPGVSLEKLANPTISHSKQENKKTTRCFENMSEFLTCELNQNISCFLINRRESFDSYIERCKALHGCYSARSLHEPIFNATHAQFRQQYVAGF